MSLVFQAQQLRDCTTAILAAAGSGQAEARQVADNLVMANLCGHDSHGVGMVPRYVDAVLEGGLVPNTAASVTADAGALLSFDGGRGYGQVVGEQAVAAGIDRAAELGSCVLALGNAHHLGRIGHFAEMAAARGLVSMHFVNVLSRPVVAPFGGGDGRFGTNPFCVGIPLGERPPFILDFATSRVAQGKMRVAHNEGRRVEPGYLIDAQGRPTEDPGVVVVPGPGGAFGALLPFGEHKGFGLAVACELLGGALAAGASWHRQADGAQAVLNGMLSVLIEPRRLAPHGRFEAEAQAFLDWVRQSPAMADEGVRIAGEPEREQRARREREGIRLDAHTWTQLQAAAGKVGATLPAAPAGAA
jgi:uncharacterized oxidoreductase